MIGEQFEEVLVNKNINLEFSESKKEDKYTFYDSKEKKDYVFYIDKLVHYDIWEEAVDKYEEKLYEKCPNLSKEKIAEYKKRYAEGIENICPRGMDLAVIEYETEDNISLNFYDKEYLDKKPVCSSGSSVTSTIMFLKPEEDDKIGINGLNKRLHIIKPVEKDFNNKIEIEMFSWHRQIPKEIVKL